jgi:hypothetical protein
MTAPPAPGRPYLVSSVPAAGGFSVGFNFQTTEDLAIQQVFRFIASPSIDPLQGFVYERELVPQISGDTWGVLPFFSPANTTFYMFASSTANGQTVYSPYFAYNPNATGAPSSPTAPPSLVSVTNTTITVGFSAAGITGNTPLQILCNASASPAMTNLITCAVSLVSPNNYRAVASGLTPQTLYYFQTIVSNGVLPNQGSTVSAGIATAAANITDPPFAVNIEATLVTMRFTVGITIFNPAVVTADLFWGNVTPVNRTPAVYLGIIAGQPTWEASVSGLTPGTTYYFAARYTPSAISTPNVVEGTANGNDFDLGYMPPRPWAAPNPVIVRGVSEPWRQT